MPASKPSNLIKRHETAAEKSARESAENAMNSGRQLPQEAPARLTKHKVAAKAWRSMMREYNAIEGQIVTRLDQDLLIDYCILVEQADEIDRLRKSAFMIWEKLGKAYANAIMENHPEEAVQLMGDINDSFENIIKLDGRADRKRALMLQIRQSLYLTPRSRAGAAPDPKEKEEPKDALEKLLDEANEIINGGQGAK